MTTREKHACCGCEADNASAVRLPAWTVDKSLFKTIGDFVGAPDADATRFYAKVI
ncbi:MAG: hypothetical protein WB676_22330 [Bryobacteraceae bacterium]